MKKSFFAFTHTIRKFTKRYKDELLISLYIAWIIVSIVICYTFYPNIYSADDMPNDEAYIAYENVINEIVDGNIKNVVLPDNARISISLDKNENKNKIVISNTKTYYSVTGKITETKIKYTRKSGAAKRMNDRVDFSFAFGLMLLGALGGLVLYSILFVIFLLLKLFINLICNFVDEYKREKRKLCINNKNKQKR